MLLALIDRGAGVSDLAEALDQSLDEITRAGRSLSMRGLIRWHHVGSRKETRFDITSSGLTTVRALLTAVDATAAPPAATPQLARPGLAVGPGAVPNDRPAAADPLLAGSVH